MAVLKPSEREKADVLVQESNEQEYVQPQTVQLQATQPIEQALQVADSVQDASEQPTFWDSLVVKKGKDHDKPRKKHQGSTVEDRPENKPDEN